MVTENSERTVTEVLVRTVNKVEEVFASTIAETTSGAVGTPENLEPSFGVDFTLGVSLVSKTGPQAFSA